MKIEEGRFIGGGRDQVSGVRPALNFSPVPGDARTRGEGRKLNSRNLRSSGSICGFDFCATVPGRRPTLQSRQIQPNPGKSGYIKVNQGEKMKLRADVESLNGGTVESVPVKALSRSAKDGQSDLIQVNPTKSDLKNIACSGNRARHGCANHPPNCAIAARNREVAEMFSNSESVVFCRKSAIFAQIHLMAQQWHRRYQPRVSWHS